MQYKVMRPSELTNVNFIFNSPRMEFGQFDEIIRSRGLNRNQVTVIGSAGDYPHWVDKTLLNSELSILDYLKDYVGKSWNSYYGQNPNPSYRWIFLQQDLTAINSSGQIGPILNHGAMFNGETQGHRYNLLIDGVLARNVTIAGAYHDEQ